MAQDGPPTPQKHDIEPMLTTVWAQNDPYHYYTPAFFTGEQCVTGCVSVAAAQVMKYYEWPKRGIGSSSYDWNNGVTTKELTCDYEHDYDWSLMVNDIDTAAMILRKGSVSAAEGERLIIPINMRDGSLICTGKGNEDWNCSAPHGAGRLMSRSEAKASFTVSQFKKEMEGIYSTTVNRSTLDEAPMAYKSMEDIVSNIGDTVTVEKVIKPIYNFKAGDVD